PDARIFLKACAALDIEPSSAIFVGDLYELDVVGARNAGLKPIWLDRAGKQSTETNAIRNLHALKGKLPAPG
ncbi:MAG: HAD family hydrolase, partial [Bdellovibrionota bacterium]